MTFVSDRFDGFRLQRSNTSTSNDEPAFSFYNPTPRSSNSRPVSQSSAFDTRNSLQRRFTTQGVVQTLSSLSPIGQQRRSGIEMNGMNDSIFRKAQLLEKKQAEFEFLRQKKLQFQQEMDMIEAQSRREEEELYRLRQDLGQFQSEPTTPPEEAGFASVRPRSHRLSTSGFTSPGVINRPSRAGSQVTSPPVERARAYQALTGGFVPQSVPGSRHDSEADEAGDEYGDNIMSFNHRGAAARNRNSMPVTRRDHRQGFADLASALGGVDTASFLFGDDEQTTRKQTSRPASGILSMAKNGDNFPVLIRSDQNATSAAMSLSASSDALDLANSQQHELEDDNGGWPSAFSPPNNRASMPPTTSGIAALLQSDAPPDIIPLPASSGRTSPTKQSANRHSMGARMAFTETKRPSLLPTPGSSLSSMRIPTKLQTSFSTSSVPTVSSLNNGTTNPSPTGAMTPSQMTAEQRFHNHNASLGRVPAGAVNNRHSRDLSTILDVRSEQESANSPLTTSSLHAQAPIFNGTTAKAQEPAGLASAFNATGANYNAYLQQLQPQMQMLNAAMNNMQLAQHGQPQMFAQVPGFQQPSSGYGHFQQFSNARGQDSQARIMQQRRNQGSGGDDFGRFNNITLESLRGEILNLCRDQHGCRYLQKQIEMRKPESIELIFLETKEHMTELMVDPFGNYLCQKLFEFTDEDQRTELINNAASHMVAIALNQHGTRALQKMIEFVTNPAQIQTVIRALRHEVVRMIQDLNGNHVIQKCLNHLSPEDAQFIFDAVAGNVVAVGTHRHGCCVIQRCIDHATGNQKAQLVHSIIASSMPLVQDPFGNYVLQYIFDQNEPAFSDPMCRTFLGKLSGLSKQKFSSNVIEKCIRIAQPEVKNLMIQEIISASDFERLADDPYANYVVQTAWEYADETQEAILAEKIRPILSRMRHKPYGRRFATRLSDRDKRLGRGTPEISSPESNFSPISGNGHMHRASMSQDMNYMTGNIGFSGMNNPASMTQMTPAGYGIGQAGNRHNNQMMQNGFWSQQFQPMQMPHQGQHGQQQGFINYGRNSQGGTGFY